MKNKKLTTAVRMLNNIADEAMAELKDRIIYFEDDGSYCVFDRFKIKQENAVITVSTLSGTPLNKFYSMPNALAWCIFEYRNKYYDSRRIIDLDRQLASTDADILIHKRLYSRSKPESREIYELKLHEDTLRRKSIVDDLHHYISAGHDWQINRFNRKR